MKAPLPLVSARSDSPARVIRLADVRITMLRARLPTSRPLTKLETLRHHDPAAAAVVDALIDRLVRERGLEGQPCRDLVQRRQT